VRVDVGVGPLLERQFDVAPDARSAGDARALVRGLHDARARAGDDREALLAEQLPDLDRGEVLRVVGMRARRAEDRDALLDARELVEALDELRHDAHHAPRVGGPEVGARSAVLEELRVLGERPGHVTDRVVGRGALEWFVARRGEQLRRAASLVDAGLQSGDRLLRGDLHALGVRALAARRARRRGLRCAPRRALRLGLRGVLHGRGLHTLGCHDE